MWIDRADSSAAFTSDGRSLSERSASLSEARIPRYPRLVLSNSAGSVDLVSAISDPVDEQIKSIEEKLRLQHQTIHEVKARLRELKEDAEAADDLFSTASAANLCEFIGLLGLKRRPLIFLLENGNLRIVWRNARKEQVGLQFLGNGIVQFVMFALRTNPAMMMREAGVDVMQSIRGRISSSGCEHVVYG